MDFIDQLRADHPGETIGIVSHHRNERLLSGWLATGGGLDEQIGPDAFLEKGVPPADFTRFTLGRGRWRRR